MLGASRDAVQRITGKLAWAHQHAYPYAAGDFTMKEIADVFGGHYSAVSLAVREFEMTAVDRKGGSWP